MVGADIIVVGAICTVSKTVGAAIMVVGAAIIVKPADIVFAMLLLDGLVMRILSD